MALKMGLPAYRGSVVGLLHLLFPPQLRADATITTIRKNIIPPLRVAFGFPVPRLHTAPHRIMTRHKFPRVRRAPTQRRARQVCEARTRKEETCPTLTMYSGASKYPPLSPMIRPCP